MALERQTGPSGNRKGLPNEISRSFMRGKISFISLMSEASSDNRGRMMVGRAPDDYSATCARLYSRRLEYAPLFEPAGYGLKDFQQIHVFRISLWVSKT